MVQPFKKTLWEYAFVDLYLGCVQDTVTSCRLLSLLALSLPGKLKG